MSLLRRAWRAWKRVAQFLGDAIARVILTLFYFTIVAPFGLGIRIWGDRLQLKRRARIGWWNRTTSELNLDDARRLG